MHMKIDRQIRKYILKNVNSELSGVFQKVLSTLITLIKSPGRVRQSLGFRSPSGGSDEQRSLQTMPDWVHEGTDLFNEPQVQRQNVFGSSRKGHVLSLLSMISLPLSVWTSRLFLRLTCLRAITARSRKWAISSLPRVPPNSFSHAATFKVLLSVQVYSQLLEQNRTNPTVRNAPKPVGSLVRPKMKTAESTKGSGSEDYRARRWSIETDSAQSLANVWVHITVSSSTPWGCQLGTQKLVLMNRSF